MFICGEYSTPMFLSTKARGEEDLLATVGVDEKTKASYSSRRRALEMNPSSMNWIPQETTMVGADGRTDGKKNSLTVELISFSAAKFRHANASSPEVSVEVLSSNGSNCACRDSSLRLSSRTEIGLWNARNLRAVAASSTAPPCIADFIASSPPTSEDEASLVPLIIPSLGTNTVMYGRYEPDSIKWDELSYDPSNSGPEFVGNSIEKQLKIIFSECLAIKNLTLADTLDNYFACKMEKASPSDDFKTRNLKCIGNDNTCENQSYKQTYRKDPRLAVEVAKNESISVNWSSGSSSVEGIISFRLKGISEHGQGHPNAISNRAWQANVSRNDGQSLADGQVSAAGYQSAAGQTPTSTTDCQFSSMEYQSFPDCHLSPVDCQPLVKDCSSSVSCRLSNVDLQSPAKDRQSSAQNWQSSAGKTQPSAKTCQSPRLASRVLLTFLVLAALNFQATSAKIRSRDESDPVSNIRHVLPELELGNNSVTDVRFNEGSTAFLPCRFPTFPRHHENRVSWIRRWDWHILTAGVFTYTNDDRFVVLHKDGTNDWTLQIKFLHTQDNGTYECQVHTGSGFMSQFVNLFVITPRAAILEPREFTIETGQDFSLTCIIQQSLEPPVYVMWLHGGVPVNYAPDRPRLNVELVVKGSTSRSILSVKNAKYGDSGNYTCTAPNAVNAWVLVYVTEGDTVAAVQRRQPNSSRTITPEIDGAPALPSKTNAAPRMNIFFIPFVSTLMKLSSAVLETDFFSHMKPIHYHHSGKTCVSNVECSVLCREFLDWNTDHLQSRESVKFDEQTFTLSRTCGRRRSFFTNDNHLKFRVEKKSIALDKIDFLLSACIYLIAFQMITSFLLGPHYEIQREVTRPDTSSDFYPSLSSQHSSPCPERSIKPQVCKRDERSQISCFILNESVWTSR